MKKLITLTFVFALFFTTLTVYAEKPDADLNIPKSSSSSSSSKESTKDVPVPDDVTPVKAYTATVGKSYKLPAAIKKAGDSYATSNSAILTVDKTTGNFKAVNNGTAYLVITNGTNKSYVKITVGMGTANSTKAVPNATSALSSYSVAVSDKTTPAVTAYGQTSNKVYTYYFVSKDGVKLGSITIDDQRKIAQAGVDNGTIPTESKDMAVWFANEFNVYRGLAVSIGASTNTTGEQKSSTQVFNVSSFNVSDQTSDALRLINEKRRSTGLSELSIDTLLAEVALIRVSELEEKYSHERPDGSRSSQEYICSEVINRKASTGKIAVDSWMNSNPHYKILMDSDADAIGIAAYKGSDGVVYWCALVS